MRVLLMLAVLPASVLPQSIAVPRAGITFDQYSKSFRPVFGVPGASMLGNALELRGELHNVTICSQQQFALAATGRESIVALLHLDSLTSIEVSPAAIAAPTHIELSAGCSAAAIYSARANRLQILTGLPGKPVIAADVVPDFPAAVSSLAVSDDGQSVLAAVPGKAVYLVPAAGRAVALLPLEGDAAVGWRGNGEAIVADRHSNSVMLFANLTGSPSSTVIAGPDHGINAPSAVWFDARTHSVLVANSGSGKVNLLPLSGGNSAVIDCRCALGGLSPLTDRTYQLEAASADQPLRILDLGASPPRVVFVATPEHPLFPKGHGTASSSTSGK